jgi:hypothetical protein
MHVINVRLIMDMDKACMNDLLKVKDHFYSVFLEQQHIKGIYINSVENTLIEMGFFAIWKNKKQCPTIIFFHGTRIFLFFV